MAQREAALAGSAEAMRRGRRRPRRARARERATGPSPASTTSPRGTVPGLVAMVNLRDRYTARHSASVGRLCRLLAAELGWPAEDVALAHMTGLVHDIGKVGLPDEVLRKPGRPTAEEWVLIHRHADWGADALEQMRLMPAAWTACAATTSAGTAAATRGAARQRDPLPGRASSPSATRTTP